MRNRMRSSQVRKDTLRVLKSEGVKESWRLDTGNPPPRCEKLEGYHKKVSDEMTIGGIPPLIHKPWFSKIRG